MVDSCLELCGLIVSVGRIPDCLWIELQKNGCMRGSLPCCNDYSGEVIEAMCVMYVHEACYVSGGLPAHLPSPGIWGGSRGPDGPVALPPSPHSIVTFFPGMSEESGFSRIGPGMSAPCANSADTCSGSHGSASCTIFQIFVEGISGTSPAWPISARTILRVGSSGLSPPTLFCGHSMVSNSGLHPEATPLSVVWE